MDNVVSTQPMIVHASSRAKQFAALVR